MDNIIIVKVIDGAKSLREELECLRLTEDVFRILEIKEIAHFGILHNDVDILIVIEGIPDFDDVGMIDFGVELDFPFDEFHFGFGW